MKSPRLKFAQRLEDIEQRVVGVRVIDKNLKLSFRRHGFESARHLRRSRQAENRLAQINAQRVRRGQRSHRIRDVEPADQRNAHEITLAARVELIGCAAQTPRDNSRRENRRAPPFRK